MKSPCKLKKKKLNQKVKPVPALAFEGLYLAILVYM